MYITNNTSSTSSSGQASSFVPLQQDLLVDEDQPYNLDYMMIDKVFEYYHQVLTRSSKLLEMLLRRKVDLESINRLQIGFADRTLGFELQSHRRIQGSMNRGHLQRLGLLRASGHELFRGAMVFPYRNNEGQIVGAYGRRPYHQRRSPVYHLYWNAEQVTLFNADSQRLPETIILCKSALDALALLTTGIKNVVATMGIKGFNEIHLSRIHKDSVCRVYIAFDNTPTANHYAFIVAQALDAADIECFRIKLPLGMDVNKYAMSQPDVVAAFNHLIESAVPLKQRTGTLLPSMRRKWLTRCKTVDDGIKFYLEYLKQSGRTYRTLNASRIHLERFHAYCKDNGISSLIDLSSEVLASYKGYLENEINIFTGNVISSVTQMERMDSVTRMLSILRYYGVINELVSVEDFDG